MSIGNLQTEADLNRFLEQRLRTPGVLPGLSLPFKDVKFGSATLEWAGALDSSKEVQFAHGLGEEPAAVVATATNGAADNVNVGNNTRSATQLGFVGKTVNGAVPAAGTKITFDWVAFC